MVLAILGILAVLKHQEVITMGWGWITLLSFLITYVITSR